MNDATFYRIVAKRSRLTAFCARALKLSFQQQIQVAKNKDLPLLYRVAALRCLVWDSSIGLGRCYLPKRRLVRQALGI